MNQRIISAIDIGTTKIVALVGIREDNGKFRLLGIGRSSSLGIRRGNIQNISQATESIRLAVEKAEQMSGHKMKNVVVGIAGQNIRSLVHSGYINRPNADIPISEQEVKNLISDQFHVTSEPGEEILHVIPRNYTIDGEPGINDPVGWVGRRLEGVFNIIIGRANEISYIRKCVEQNNLNLIDMYLEPLASARAVLTQDELEVGVAMIDIGGGTSDLAIYHKNSLCHTAVIPFGGNVVTHDITEILGILERNAEDLKCKYGSCLPEATENTIISIPGISGREPKEIEMPVLAEIIKARVEEIIGSLEFQIMNSGYAQRLGAGIVLTGGGSMLKNLRQFVSFKTGFDNRIGYPIEHISSDCSDSVNTPDYSTAVGLMLLANDNQRFDIIPEPEPIIVEEPVQNHSFNTLGIDEMHAEVEKEEKKEKPKKEPKKSGGGLKKTFSDLFQSIITDKDTELN